jgi:hypothetical protein
MDEMRQTECAIDVPRRGGACFAFKLAGFAAVQLLLFTMAEFKLSQAPNPYNIKKAELESCASTRVLLLGSSHVLNGLNPDELGVPAINLAGYSQDLYYDSQLVLKYLDRMPALECVVLGLSYFTLEYDMEASSEAWRSCYYRRYFGIPHRHLGNEFDLRNFSLFMLYGPDISRQLLIGQSPDVSAFVQANGWAANPVPDDPRAAVSDGPARVSAHHGLMHAENIARNLAILGELLDVLQQRGIEVVLVTTPVHQSYSAHYDPEREARFRQAISHLQSRHGARYFDFTSDQRFDIGDFFNSDHLNQIGATKLSRIFGRELRAVVSDHNMWRLSSQKQPKSF